MKSTIVRAGILTTIQAGPRIGKRSIGVSVGGALDLFAFEVLNRLVGNDGFAAGLEVHSGTVRLIFPDRRVVAWGGGEYDVSASDELISPGHASVVREGEELRLKGPRRGFRAWLAISGGFDVPEILGSQSTDIRSKFGGWEGRALRDDDSVPLKPNPAAAEDVLTRLGQRRTSSWAAPFEWMQPAESSPVLRIVPGSEWDSFSARAQQDLLRGEFTVAAESDRMGVRLTGPKLLRARPEELVSEAVVPGTLQVPGQGDPILLLGDCQTIGGYAKIAHVITVDLSRAAQLRPGDRVRFRRVSLDEAHAEFQRRLQDLRIFRIGLGLTKR